jgi:hypothetical protein
MEWTLQTGDWQQLPQPCHQCRKNGGEDRMLVCHGLWNFEASELRSAGTAGTCTSRIMRQLHWHISRQVASLGWLQHRQHHTAPQHHHQVQQGKGERQQSKSSASEGLRSFAAASRLQKHGFSKTTGNSNSQHHSKCSGSFLLLGDHNGSAISAIYNTCSCWYKTETSSISSLRFRGEFSWDDGLLPTRLATWITSAKRHLWFTSVNTTAVLLAVKNTPQFATTSNAWPARPLTHQGSAAHLVPWGLQQHQIAQPVVPVAPSDLVPVAHLTHTRRDTAATSAAAVAAALSDDEAELGKLLEDEETEQQPQPQQQQPAAAKQQPLLPPAASQKAVGAAAADTNPPTAAAKNQRTAGAAKVGRYILTLAWPACCHSCYVSYFASLRVKCSVGGNVCLLAVVWWASSSFWCWQDSESSGACLPAEVAPEQ